MKQLKKEFTKKGVNFKQIYKDKDLVIYETEYPSYEVFKLKTHLPDKYHDDVYEMYPYDEAFGVWAWSCSSKESVKRIIKEHFPDSVDKKIF